MADCQSAPMRCRTGEQVPKCFRDVHCPYSKASTADGEFGAINYSLTGPDGGELVVCLHGLNGSRMLFHDLSEYLSRYGGFRVLAFDLYGHGLSNAPEVDLCPCRSRCCCVVSRRGGLKGRYDLDFFVNQTDELLHLLGLGDSSVNLIGFSLGGTIAISFAQRFPGRVRRLVPMSPAGFLPKAPLSYHLLRAFWCCLIPMAPHLLCTCLYRRERFSKSFRGKGQEADSAFVESLWRRIVWQLYVKKGVASATLAVCHRVPWFQLKPLFVETGRSRRPVLLVWGERDALNPVKTVAPKVQSCFSNSQLLVVPGAGHIALCEKPRLVISRILVFLQFPPDVHMSSVNLSGLQPQVQDPLVTPACEQIMSCTQIESHYFIDKEDDPKSDRRQSFAAQMPVPIVLGHVDASFKDDKSTISGQGSSRWARCPQTAGSSSFDHRHQAVLAHSDE